MKNYKEERPWGTFEILQDEEDYKVKKITVYPGKRLSLQSHQCRDETWIPIQGFGKVQRENQTCSFGYVPLFELTGSSTIVIPRNMKHRVHNTADTDLIFIEVQTGESFEEDDIIRYEDDFGRL